MNRSALAKAVFGIAVAILLGLLAGRQQQLIDSQREIMREIRDIKTSLQREPAAPSAAGGEFQMRIDDAAVKGNANAKVALIEFSDFECPYCARYVQESYHQIERDYVSKDRVRYVFRHFPLAQIHPRAVKAGEAAECARQQGQFWPYHDRLFANPKALDAGALVEHARAVGLKAESFESCLAGQASLAVLNDFNLGARVGVTATPTFFLGFIQADGSVRVVDKLVGAKPYADFQTALDRLLASADSGR